MLATIENDNQNWQVEFNIPKDSVISDENGGKWSPDEEIILTFNRHNLRVEFPLEHVGSYHNSYVNSYIYYTPSCPTIYCCDNLAFEMKHNSTWFDLFTAGLSRLYYDLDINIEQGNYSIVLKLNQDKTEETIESFYADIHLNFYDPMYIPPTQYIAVNRDTYENPFLILDTYVGEEINKIGISQGNFELAISSSSEPCTIEKGRGFFKVNDGLYYNQFSKFIPISVSSFLNAVFSQNMSYLDIEYGLPLKLAMIPNSQAVTLISLEIEAEKMRIRKLIGEPVIVKKGYYSLNPEDIQLILYTDIMNVGKVIGSFTLINKDCCFGEIGNPDVTCAPLFSSVEKSIEPSQTHRVLIMENVANYVYNTTGYCTFTMNQYGIEEEEFTIPFDFSQLECSNCHLNCTIDQVYNFTDGKCYPDDCWLKYAGSRNWYDPRDGICKPSELCRVFDVENNECVEFEPEPQIPVTFPSHESPFYSEIDCGPNGVWDELSLSCICNEGWENDINQPMFDFKWCTIEVIVIPEAKEDKYLKQSHIILISVSILVIIITIIIIACILCRRRKSKKDKNKNKRENKEPSNVSIPPSPNLSRTVSENHIETVWNSLHPRKKEDDLTSQFATPFMSSEDQLIIENIFATNSSSPPIDAINS